MSPAILIFFSFYETSEPVACRKSETGILVVPFITIQSYKLGLNVHQAQLSVKLYE